MTKEKFLVHAKNTLNNVNFFQEILAENEQETREEFQKMRDEYNFQWEILSINVANASSNPQLPSVAFTKAIPYETFASEKIRCLLVKSIIIICILAIGYYIAIKYHAMRQKRSASHAWAVLNSIYISQAWFQSKKSLM